MTTIAHKFSRAAKPWRSNLLAAFAAVSLIASSAVVAAEDGKLRIICFGAHPDDCEIGAAGTAVLWAMGGHHVKFVSVTNGDIGHWREAGGPLFLRRKAEVEATAKVLGITAQVLDIHDGELEPTLENRRKIIRLIREWQADIVAEWYGAETAAKVKYAEGFELGEYGRRPDPSELAKLFPFLPAPGARK